MKKIIIVCLSEIALLIMVFSCLRPVLAHFNIYDEDLVKERNTIHVRMLDEPDNRSYGNEMRILYVKVNGKNLDLAAYDTEDWVWHGEWGYTLFTSGDHDFYIHIDEKLHTLDFCYIKQEGSGKCEIYLNDHLEKTPDMYSSKWKNANLFISFLSPGQMIFRGAEIWMLLSLLLFICVKAVRTWKYGSENTELKFGIGTFNLAKGLGIVLIVFVHAGLCVLTAEDIVSGSLILAVLFIFLTYGLIPAFFIMGGFGRKNKRVSAGVKTSLKEMLVPYAVISLIIGICFLLKANISSTYGFGELKKDIISLALMLIHDKDINGVFFRSIGPLWFTTSFALGSILFSLALAVKKEIVRYAVIVIMLILTGFLMSEDLAFFCITTGLMAALYMYAGHVIHEGKLLKNNGRKYAVILALILPVMLLAVLNGTSFAVSGNTMGNSFVLGVIVSILAAVIYIKVCVNFYVAFPGKFRVLGMIGRYSYPIFFAHALEYMIIPWRDIAEYLPENKAVRILIIFFLRSAVIALFTLIFLALSRIKKHKTEPVHT